MAKVNPAQFIQQVRAEASKITWPTRKETIATTIMVFIMTALTAIFFFFVDIILKGMVKLIVSLGA